MPKHGTASISLGLWAEFVSVVTRNLPRDLDPEWVKLWVDSAGQSDLRDRLQRVFAAPPTSRLVKTLTVTCHGNATATQLSQLGKYDWSDDRITDEHFPIPPHTPVMDELELFQFDYYVSWDEMLAERTRRNLGEPSPEHGLSLGIQHPDEQRAHPIVITHEPIRDRYGRPSVLVLCCDANGRKLERFDTRHRWDPDYVFAGVRKVA